MTETRPAAPAVAPHGIRRRVLGYAMASLAWGLIVLGLALNPQSPGALLVRHPEVLIISGCWALWSFATVGRADSAFPTTRAWLVGSLQGAGLLAITVVGAIVLDSWVRDAEGPGAACYLAGVIVFFLALLMVGHPRRPAPEARRKAVAYVALAVAAAGVGLVLAAASGWADALTLLGGAALALAGGTVAFVLLRRNAADAKAAATNPPRADPA